MTPHLLTLSLLALALCASGCEAEECVGEGEVRFEFTKLSKSDEAVYLTGDVAWMYCDAPEEETRQRRSYAISLSDGESQRITEIPASSVIPLQADETTVPLAGGALKLIDNASANINVSDLHVGDLTIGGKLHDVWVSVSPD
ncbi:hypothetical protein KKF91_00425 [Myxococcota bacterium]|nr:hypothetical protein [Myxococcota bacterium]MBU1428999.1 hypothetical protein [Myxococcota bacterium]MBU1896988.1 hypothetical protein [Myxococcota bacterium]